MFERLTERARQVVIIAQDEARSFHHGYVGTEHLLLGLLREADGLAARVLDSFDIKAEEVQQRVEQIVGAGDHSGEGQIPFTPRAKKVLELALREALSLNHNYIGTEHILLGLLRENEGVAARILLDFDATSEKVRKEVLRLVALSKRVIPDMASGDTASTVRASLNLKDLSSNLATLHAQVEAAKLTASLISLLDEATAYIKHLRTQDENPQDG